MKSVVQWGALIVVLFGGIFLTTYLTQHSPTQTPTADKPEANPGRIAPLKVYERTAVWDPSDSQYVQEYGTAATGHYDFLVANENDKPVTVILDAKFGCTCTNLDVRLGLIPGPARAKLAAAKPMPTGTQLVPYLTDMHWKTLVHEGDQKPIEETIPAADGSGPQFAVVRMSWETKEEKATTLKAQVQARLGAAAEHFTFDVPLAIVAPIMVAPRELPLGDLKPGDKREQSFYLWSAIRDKIDAKVQTAVDDPCIVVGEPRPLSAEELKKLSDDLLAAQQIVTKTKPKTGYVVTVSVAESRGENQLELGPLLRRVVVNRGGEGEASVTLTGIVRGSIRVGDTGDNDLVDLRVFSGTNGTEKMVIIRSGEPGLALTIDHVKPPELKVQLQPGAQGFGTRQWKLIVDAPPNALAGPLPPDSAIYLKTNSTPPRRIRIPVKGNASG